MGLGILTRRFARSRPTPEAAETLTEVVDAYEPAEAVMSESDPLDRCLELERFGHILLTRTQWQERGDIEAICCLAGERIDETFAIVPEGFASLPRTLNDVPGCAEVTIETESFIIGRHAVTHRQFQNFVDDGGYGELELWPREIWPHLIDFVDQTDCPGPRFWQHGRHNRRLWNHPVVGICSYEAAAYSKWAGYRLPTEAEWQMAASWRIRSAANVLRRYPWGDTFDADRCNVWASGIGQTVAVDEFADGSSPNHVLQFIGNVWEWTSCEFNVTSDDGGVIIGDMRLSAIRGGAFDTYFASQATSVFRTGLVSLARADNVGFRCAMSLCDREAGRRAEENGVRRRQGDNSDDPTSRRA
ncbi:MAG: formylglycine-generating enzyme family protein [Phycisphaerae bacterium]